MRKGEPKISKHVWCNLWMPLRTNLETTFSKTGLMALQPTFTFAQLIQKFSGQSIWNLKYKVSSLCVPVVVLGYNRSRSREVEQSTRDREVQGSYPDPSSSLLSFVFIFINIKEVFIQHQCLSGCSVQLHKASTTSVIFMSVSLSVRFCIFFLLLSWNPKGIVPQVLETGCKPVLLFLFP